MTDAAQPETPDELIAATGQEVAQTTRDQFERTMAAIRRDPLKGVALAAGLGFLASVIVRRW